MVTGFLLAVVARAVAVPLAWVWLMADRALDALGEPVTVAAPMTVDDVRFLVREERN